MMTKRTELYIDIAKTDLATARVRLFTEFNQAGDANISYLTFNFKNPNRLIVGVSGEMSEAQQNFAAQRLG